MGENYFSRIHEPWGEGMIVLVFDFVSHQVNSEEILMVLVGVHLWCTRGGLSFPHFLVRGGILPLDCRKVVESASHLTSREAHFKGCFSLYQEGRA